ncbi:MAG: hypothetical protein AAB688_02570 [Patescibacteria group bacterium]
MTKKLIRLTRNNWWSELSNCKLPNDITTLLRSIIPDYLSGATGVRAPDANFITNELLKKHLMEGFMIDDCIFDVVIFIPNPNKGQNKIKGKMRRHRSFYKIIERHLGYDIRTLQEIK